MFGGRGASSGMSIAGRKYGTEYKTLHVKDSVKYIRYNFSMASKNPFETQAKDRIYAIVNFQDEVKSIVFFDSNGMKSKEKADLFRITELSVKNRCREARKLLRQMMEADEL